MSASLVLLGNGRVTGISGILNALLEPARGVEFVWRALFVVGMLAGGLVAAAVFPMRGATPGLMTAAAAGVFVGVGTRLGNGCTSGHGVCGVSRLSPRSLAATLTFITTGAFVVGLRSWVEGAW